MRFFFAGLVAATLMAEPLTQTERDMAMSNLHATRKLFLDSIDGLSDEQWTYKAAPDRWSIAECAEHIAAADDLIWTMITEKVMKTPADPSKRSEVKGKDEKVRVMITDRSRKFQAPEVLQPTKRWPNRAALIAHFKESRDRAIAYIETTNDDLRDHFAPHPAAGLLDAYQWFLLMSAHTERHVKQIREVKAAPGYPRS